MVLPVPVVCPGDDLLRTCQGDATVESGACFGLRVFITREVRLTVPAYAGTTVPGSWLPVDWYFIDRLARSAALAGCWLVSYPGTSWSGGLTGAETAKAGDGCVGLDAPGIVTDPGTPGIESRAGSVGLESFLYLPGIAVIWWGHRVQGSCLERGHGRFAASGSIQLPVCSYPVPAAIGASWLSRSLAGLGFIFPT